MTEDPTRLSAVSDSPELVSLLRAARERAPNGSELARLRTRVQASVGVPLSAPSSELHAPTPSHAPSASFASAPGSLALWLPISALLVMGGVFLVVHGSGRQPVRPTSATPVVPSQLLEPAYPPQVQPAPLPGLRTAPPMFSGAPVHRSVPLSVVGARSKSIPPVSASASGPSVQFEQPSEVDLVGRAGRILKRDPTQALALTSEHRQLYPAGALSEEREVIAIDALARLSKLAAARARAEQFILAFPRSAHLQRVEATAKLQAIDAGVQKETLDGAQGE